MCQSLLNNSLKVYSGIGMINIEMEDQNFISSVCNFVILVLYKMLQMS